MYKNFNITEKEKQQILESHMKHGYKKPLNENADDSLDVNEAERSPVKQVINSIFRKNGIKKVASHTTSVSGFRRYEGRGYQYNYGGSVSFHKIPEEVIEDLANQMRAAGVKVERVYSSSIDFDNRELKTSDESMNELDGKDIDLIKGKPDFKTKSGKPVGDYVSKRNASRQFQHDFEKDFADPSDEYTPYWMKDRPNSDGDSELELDIRNSARQADRESTKQPEKDTMSQDRDERIKLRRKIASLLSHRKEFGGDEELDRVIDRLRAQDREMDDNR
jgi:hypothetical protein